MSVRLPSRPKLASRPARPAFGRGPDLPAFTPPEPGKPATDEHGLDREAFEQLSPLGRQYLARAYEYLGLDKRLVPTSQTDGHGLGITSGTIPELVFFGGLLARGFDPGGYSNRSFVFQSFELGGRKTPGGAVVDFVLYHNGRVIGVRVDSVFHSLADPFGRGQSEVEEARTQKLKLLARSGINAVVDVNKARKGYPMEHGPDALIATEFDEVLSA